MRKKKKGAAAGARGAATGGGKGRGEEKSNGRRRVDRDCQERDRRAQSEYPRLGRGHAAPSRGAVPTRLDLRLRSLELPLPDGGQPAEERLYVFGARRRRRRLSLAKAGGDRRGRPGARPPLERHLHGRQRRGEAGPRGFDQAALRELAARRPQDLGQRRSPGREHPRDPRGAQDHAPPDPRLPRLLRDLDLLDFLAFGARHCPDAAPGACARRGPRAAAGRREEVPGPRRAGAGRRVLPAQPRGLGGESAELRGQARAASQGPAGLRGGLQDGRARVSRRRPLLRSPARAGRSCS